MLRLFAHDTEQCLEEKVRTRSNNPNDLCVINHEGPRAEEAEEAEVEPSGRQESTEHTGSGVRELINCRQHNSHRKYGVSPTGQ